MMTSPTRTSIGIADGDGGQVGLLNLDDGDVRSDVAADQLRQHAPAIGEADLDARGIFDDMIVGQDVAVGRIDDDAGAAGPERLFLDGVALARGWRRQEFNLLVRFADDADRHDRRDDFLENRCKRTDGAAGLRRFAPCAAWRDVAAARTTTPRNDGIIRRENEWPC